MVLSVMIITCPSCATRYSLDDSKIPDDGRQVRCVQCSHVWHQDPAQPDDLLSLDETSESLPGADVPQLEEASQASAAENAVGTPAGEPPDEEPPDDEAIPQDSADTEPVEEEASGDEPPEETDGEESGPPDQEVEIGGEDDVFIDVDEEPQPTDGEPRLGGAGSSAWRSVRERAIEPEEMGRADRGNLIGWAILGVVVVSVVAIVVFFRSDLEDAWPSSKRLYSTFDDLVGRESPLPPTSRAAPAAPVLPSLDVSIDVTSSRIDLINGERVLLIEGMITNSGNTDAPVPNLRGSLLDEDGESLYSWDFSVPFLTISAGTQREFETRVVDPPAGARNMNLEPVPGN